MKSKRLLLLLLMALCMPWVANAQSTLTVYGDNTTTNEFVPIYGYYADSKSKCEFIIPSEKIDDMNGGTISAMKFYLDHSDNASFYSKINATFEVFVKEVEATTLSGFVGNSGATTVFNNTITIELDASNVELDIPFSSDYPYNGGNLLVGFYQTATTGYNHTYWTGEAQTTNTAWGGYVTDASAQQFLPKTTFTYTPGSSTTTAPSVTTNQVANNITNTSVTLGGTITDMGGATGVYAGICYSTTNNPTTSDGHVHSRLTSTGAYTQNISDLQPNTLYFFRAYAYNNANSLDEPTYGDVFTFFTCGDITLNQPANGEISVSVNGGTATTSSTYASQSDQVILTATPAEGYSLDSWNVTGVTGTANGNTYTFTMPTNNVTATASFIPTSGGSSTTTAWAETTSINTSNNYLIGLVSGNDVYLVLNYNPTTSGYYYDYNYTYLGYTALATIDGNGHVTGCTGDASDLQYAQWTFETTSGGKITSVQNSGRYLYGYTSASYGDCYPNTTSTSWTYSDNYLTYSISSGTQYLHLRTISNKNYIERSTSGTTVKLYAPTEVTTYAIVATANSAEYGTVAGSDYYANGATCTLTATPAFGYEFVSWTEGGEVVSLDAAYTFTVSSARTLVANFESQGSCIKPTDLAQVPNTLAAHQAQLSWTENSGATQWEVVYSTDSEFDPNNERPIAVNGDPTVIIPSLNQETTYYARVRAICGKNSQSGWSDKANFTTISGHLAPTSLSHDPATVTAHTVTVTWTGVATNVLHESYDLYYSTSDETPSPSQTPQYTGLTDTSKEIDGLDATKTYYVWVRDNCGDDGLSEWSVYDSFTTGCDVFTVDLEHSFAQRFDASTFPICWDNPIEYISSSNRQWIRTTSQNHTATSGSGSAYSGYYGPIYLMMPDLTIANGTTDVKLNFWARLDYTSDYDGTTAKSSVVLIDGNTETELWTYDDVANITDLEDLWKDYSINLSAYKGQTISLAFKYEGDNDHGWYIDDVEVAFDPTCFPVGNLSYSNVTNHSATITWTKGTEGQDAWQLKYNKDSDFDPDTEGTLVDNLDATTYTFDKALDAESMYYIYVRANCGGDDGNSTWVKTNFTTGTANPAPTAFNKKEIGPDWVDLYWTAPASDFLSGYGIYYSTSNTAPTEEDGAIKTITDATAPTTDAPYRLTGLDNEETYYLWVRANHEANVYSAWTAISGSSITTLAACPIPSNLKANNLTQNTADLSWNGSSAVLDGDGYTVEYSLLTLSDETETTTEDFASYTAVTYNATGVLPTDWKGYSSGTNKPHVSNNNVLGTSYDIEGIGEEAGDTDNFLYMIGNSTSPNNSFTILPQFDNLVAVSFDYAYENSSYGTLSVGYCTDNTSGSTFTAFDDLTITKTATSTNVSLTADDIAAINSNNGYLAFRWNCSSSYGVAIDNVAITSNVYVAGAWQNAVTGYKTGYNYQLTGLAAGTKYGVRVYAGCTSDADNENASTSFPTKSEGIKVFVTEGNWGTAANWVPAGAPVITDEVILRANATITGDAAAQKIKMEGATTPTLTIEDGGTLQTDNTVTATVKKNIKGYGAGNEENRANYYLIANPLNSTIYYFSSIGSTNLLTGNYDLYSWSYTATDGLEWRNYESSNFSLYNGTGYLYANEADVELTFVGTVMANNTEVTKDLNYATSGTYDFNGWNLVGNPFACNSYIKDASSKEIAFYRMNEAGNGFVAATGAIKPMEGIFVKATAASQSFNFTRETPTTTTGKLNINLFKKVTSRGEKGSTDNAIIRFGEGNALEKFSFDEGNSKIYIRQDNKDYAVFNAEGTVGEIPVSFKAETKGSYTMSFTTEDVDFSYLHLIDNKTGNDVDLLAHPSYTFNAATTDYASRFRLVFAANAVSENMDSNDAFAFFNGSEWVVSNTGNATVQLVDVTGRILSSQTINGSANISLDVTPGVYMLRMVNGNEVRVQKIVVR